MTDAALIVENEFGVPASELPAVAIKALGFRRVGTQLAELGARGVRLALEKGLIRADATGHMVVDSVP